MSLLIQPTEQKAKEPKLPEGTHIARFIQAVDLGRQENKFTKGEFNNMIRLTFEFPEITKQWAENEPAKPVVYGIEVTSCISEGSNLFKVLKACDNTITHTEAQDPEAFLGLPFQVNVIHAVSKKGNKYVKLKDFAAIPRNPSNPKKYRFDIPEQFNDSVAYSINAHPRNWDKLQDWLQEIIAGSTTFQEKTGQPQPAESLDDDDLLQ